MIEEATNQPNIEPVSKPATGNFFSKIAKRIKARYPNTKLKINYKLLGIILGGVVLVYGIYAERGLVIAATVNGKPISRLAVAKETERRAGQAIMDGIINQTLIDQEAKALKITVTPQETNDDLKKLEEQLKTQGSNLDDTLKQQNLTRAAFNDILFTNKQLEKLIANRIAVTYAEVSKYLTENKDTLPKDQDPETLKPQILSFLQQQKIDTETKKLIEELRAKAKINYWVKF